MKRLKDSRLVEDNIEMNLFPGTFEELYDTIQNLQKSSKMNGKRSFQNIIQIGKLMQLSTITCKRKYTQVLKAIGYSKSYGSFMLQFLRLVPLFPDLQLVATPGGFIL